VFEIDIAHCQNCVGELKIIAAIMEQPVIEKILTHLGLQARAPPRAPARRSVATASGLRSSSNTFQAARRPGPWGSAAPQLLRAEVWRLIAGEKSKATASRDALWRCDRPSTCGE